MNGFTALEDPCEHESGFQSTAHSSSSFCHVIEGCML